MNDAILISLMAIIVSLVPPTLSAAQFLLDRRMRDEWKWAWPVTVLFLLLMLACAGAIVLEIVQPGVLFGQ